MARAYGDREGLSGSLRKWAERLGQDKSLPWPGLGLLADLKTAADMLDGVPEKSSTLEFDL